MVPDLRLPSFCCLVYWLVAVTPQARSAADTANPAPPAAARSDRPSGFAEIERRAAAQQGLSPRDKSFLMNAAQGEMLQRELSNVAVARAKNPAVRRFASATARFVGRSKTRLDHIAEEFGVSLPSIVPDAVQTAQASLSAAKSVDREYLARILADTRTESSLYKDEAVKGTNPVMVQYAQSMLPRLSQHYRNVLQMSATISRPEVAARRSVQPTPPRS